MAASLQIVSGGSQHRAKSTGFRAGVPLMPRHTLVSTLMRLTMRYGARWPSPPALYFAALDFFLAAHRALAASDRRLRMET